MLSKTKISWTVCAATVAAVGVYVATVTHVKSLYEEADAKFNANLHGRGLGGTEDMCKERYIYSSSPDQQGIPGAGGPNTMSNEEYLMIVAGSVAAGITIACLCALWGMLLFFCRCCKCKGCGGSTPTKGCCCSQDPITYTPKDIKMNKGGVLLLFVLIIVMTAIAGAGNQLFTDGLTGMFTEVIKTAEGLETTCNSMDTKLQTINMTLMEDMSTMMTDAVISIKEVEVLALGIDQLRAAAIMLVLFIPVLSGLFALCGIGSKKKAGSCCSTFFGFISLILIWLTYAVHAPFGRVGDDLCYTIDEAMCGESGLNDVVCFLSGSVRGVQDGLTDALGPALESFNNNTAKFGYNPPVVDGLDSKGVADALNAFIALVDQDIVKMEAVQSAPEFDFTGCPPVDSEHEEPDDTASEEEEVERSPATSLECSSTLASCKESLTTLALSDTDVALTMCEYLQNNAGVWTFQEVINDELKDVNKVANEIVVLYDVSGELDPYGKCDYVIDLMASMKTLLCEQLVRGVVLIQNACAIEGVLLLFFVLLTTQGAKRWVEGGAGVSPLPQ